MLAVTIFGYVRLASVVEAFDRNAISVAGTRTVSKIDRDFRRHAP